MTVRVDYTQLGQPATVLTLNRTPDGNYTVTDQNGRLWFPPTPDVTVCLRFLSAAARKRDALVDAASVERVTWVAAQEHSVRVGALSERDRGGDSRQASAPGSPKSRSESVPDNVYPIRRKDIA